MRHIDFYKKKEKIHKQMIEAICKIMDAHMVTEINFEDLGLNGGYACISDMGPVFEAEIEKLKHDIGTDYLGIEVSDEWGNTICTNLNDGVLNASFDTVYEAVHDLFYDRNCKYERERLLAKTK